MKKFKPLTISFAFILSSTFVQAQLVPTYDDGFFPMSDGCIVVSKNGKDVLINEKEEEIYVGEYNFIETDERELGYFIPVKGDKKGLVLPDGKLISTPEYDDISFDYRHPEGATEKELYIFIEKDGKVGVLDSNGKSLIELIYEEILVINTEQAYVMNDEKVQLYNYELKQFLDIKSEHLHFYNGHVGFFFFFNSNIRVFVNGKGDRINDKEYHYIHRCSSDTNFFVVRTGSNFGICDSLGNELFTPKFSKIKYWDGTFGAGKKGKRYCFFDAKGDTIVGYRYEKVKGVYNDFVSVRINSMYGVVKRDGTVVLEPTLSEKVDFNQLRKFGLAQLNAWYSTKGVVNQRMEMVLPLSYTNLKFIRIGSEVYILASRNKRHFRVYDSNGNALTSPKFIKWKQDEVGEYSFYDDYNWYRITSTGEIEAVDR